MIICNVMASCVKTQVNVTNYKQTKKQSGLLFSICKSITNIELACFEFHLHYECLRTVQV